MGEITIQGGICLSRKSLLVSAEKRSKKEEGFIVEERNAKKRGGN